MADDPTTAEALGAATALSLELVLVARPEGDLLRCVAANPAFADRFTAGADVAGRPVDDVLPAPLAARLTAAAAAGEPRDDDATDLGGRRLRVRVGPVTTTRGDRLVAWVAREQDGPHALARLRRENSELERSNVDLGEFAYLASHDLAEPLRMVTSYLELLTTRYAHTLDGQARQYLDFAADGAVRMRALIEDVLALARVGASTAPFAPVELSAVVDRARHQLHPAIAEAGAEITVGPLPVVTGDEAQLTRLLANLLANAVKFRGAGRPAVRVAATPEGAGWRVTVADNGIGIAPQFQAQVFQMFRRLNPRTAYPGTGMGLAISSRIVERHGGRMGVESHPGRGTTFWFTLIDANAPASPDERTTP